jgi:hypothetical protein
MGERIRNEIALPTNFACGTIEVTLKSPEKRVHNGKKWPQTPSYVSSNYRSEPFTNSPMKPTLGDLCAILADSNLLENGTTTRDAVGRCFSFFREEGRFDPPISFKKIGSLLRVDPKTAWKKWERFKRFGLSMGESGRPSILSNDQVNSVVHDARERFYAMELRAVLSRTRGSSHTSMWSSADAYCISCREPMLEKRTQQTNRWARLTRSPRQLVLKYYLSGFRSDRKKKLKSDGSLNPLRNSKRGSSTLSLVCL